MYSASAHNKLYYSYYYYFLYVNNIYIRMCMRQSRCDISIACFQMQTEFVDEES
jgi:hypothetical protein